MCLLYQSGVRHGAPREAFSLTSTSLVLKQESDSWDPQNNRIVQVTREMANTICYMTQYLKKKGPLPVRGHFATLLGIQAFPISTIALFFHSQNKEAFVTAAKDVITNCQSVTHFIRVIANHCLDRQCAVELTLVVEQILTITNQLSIVSRFESLLE